MQSAGSKGVYYRKLRGHLDPSGSAYIRAADEYIDEALGLLEYEEPSMRSWLERDPELERAFKAHISAIYQTLATDASRGRTVDVSLKQIDQMTWRLAAAVSMRAVMRERSFSL